MKKKILFSLVIAILCTFTFGCEDFFKEPITNDEPHTFTVLSILDQTVNNQEVYLNEEQYVTLSESENINELCEYELSPNGTVQIILHTDSLVFDVTYEDNTIDSVTVIINILSNDTSLTINKINHVDVVDNSITLTTMQYQNLLTISNLKEACDFTLAVDAKLEVSLTDKVISFGVTALDGTTATYTVNIIVLSNDTSLTINKINHVDVVDNSITLTTMQYQNLLTISNLKEACDFTLAVDAKLEVSLTDKVISFGVTALDGTTATYTVNIIVLSNDTTFYLTSVYGCDVINNKVVLDDNDWISLADNSTDIKGFLVGAVAEKAYWEATFDRENSQIIITVVAEDATTETKKYDVEVKNSFARYGNNEYGNVNAFVWDRAIGAWKTSSSKNAYTSYVKDGIQLCGSYLFEAEFTLTAIPEGSEIVLEAFRRSNKLSRLVLRASSANSFVIFTDFRDDTAFLNYHELYTEENYDGSSIKLGIIVYQGSMVMQLNGETVYRRALENFADSQFVLANTGGLKSYFKNINTETNESQVKIIHDALLADYNDAYLGKTTGSTFNLGTRTSEDFENKTFSVWTTEDGSNNNNKTALVSFYKDGNPVCGYNWAITGTIQVLYYGFNPHVVFYTYQNNSNYNKALLNLNSSSNNNCIYENYTDNITGNKNLTVVANTKGIMINDYGKITKVDDNGTSRNCYTAPFIFAYSDGMITLYLANTLVYSHQSSYSSTNAIIQARKTCKLTFSNTEITTDAKKVEEILLDAENKSAQDNVLGGNVFAVSGNALEKSSREYARASYSPNGTIFSSSKFYATFTMQNQNTDTWGQSEVTLLDESNNGVRYVHEYLSDGTYQIFTEKIENNIYSNWKLVASGMRRDIHAGIIINNGKIQFLYKNKGYQYMHTFDNIPEGNYSLSFGGKAATTRIKDLNVINDETSINSFAETLVEYTYVSAYEQRCVTYANDNADAAKGQTLLIGTSTLDYWVSTHADSYGNYVNGYLAAFEGYTDTNNDGKPDVLNFGIGATTFADWFTFYDRLIKNFEPSRIILNCGANDLNVGDSAEATYQSFLKFMGMIRADFPNIEVYIILVNPSPTTYGDKLRDKTIKYNDYLKSYLNEDDKAFIIDMTEGLADGITPIPEMWDATNHLSKAGYDVFTNYIREALGLSAL